MRAWKGLVVCVVAGIAVLAAFRPQSSRAQQSAAFKGKVLIVDHEITFADSLTEVTYNKVIFKPGGSLRVLHGGELILKANEVVCDGGADAVINGKGDDGRQGDRGGACDHCSQGNFITHNMD